MPLVRLAIVGAGFMARRRARAFLATGRVEIVGVAARHRERAASLAREIGAERAVDDYRQLEAADPEAILIEVPHLAQDAVSLWALASGRHALIGGPLASSMAAGAEIARQAEARGLVVEAGFEARYKASWERAKEILDRGGIGEVVAARSIALWDGQPESWYYDEEASGGMPLTHLSYTFVNPLRWLLGEPSRVSAFANRKKHTAPGHVREETCIANLLFPNDVLGSLTAGYVRAGEGPFWNVELLGTEGTIELLPTEMDNGGLRLSRGQESEEIDCAGAPDAFVAQAEAFLETIAGRERCRNRPVDALGDLTVAAAVVSSIREERTVRL
jgi:myo-inositol 2-dehydrogenase/D-chiro-inositol 1-dehydrogenase